MKKSDLAGNRTSEQIKTSSVNTITTSAFDDANKEGDQTAGGSLLWIGNSNNKLFSASFNNKPATIDSTGTNFYANVPVTSGHNTVIGRFEDSYAHQVTNSYNVTGITGNTATAPTYDSNGNTKVDSEGNTYTYDAKNELVKLTYKAGGNSAFTYDGAGNRVIITETNSSETVTSKKQFIFSGMAPAEEWDGTATAVLTKRLYGQGVITYSGSVGTSYYYTRDHLGSIRELLSSTGTVVTRLDYDPYGRTIVVSGTVTPDFAYAGMYQHKPSGDYLTWGRFYSPNLGRWLTRDPIHEQGGLNLYNYCGNNPINAVDPSGLDPDPIGVYHYTSQSFEEKNGILVPDSYVTQQPASQLWGWQTAMQKLGIAQPKYRMLIGHNGPWGDALEPLPPLNSGLNLAGQWKTLKPLPILSWQRCPNPNLLRGKLLEGGGILGILMMLESEANYDLIWLLRDKAAADEYQLQKDLGHPPSEAERWIAQGGA